MIDWKQVAEQYKLSPEDFRDEILIMAACVGAISLDHRQIGDSMKFTCSDDKGPLELWIRRAN